jgi:dephospho-CoA kinase
MQTFKQHLNEIHISPRNGAKYGQVIFLVGGAGSGKSTATKSFINTTNYKILNPDDLKALLVQAGNKGSKSFKAMKGVNPNTPKGASKVHNFMRDKKIGSKRARTMMRNLKSSKTKYLPNLLFDRTFSFAGEFKKISQELFAAGYRPENIHVVYVMTDVEMALERNKTRSRSLKKDVVIGTNKGAMKEFTRLFFNRAKGAMANGDYFIIINRGQSSIQVKQAGKRIDRASIVSKKVASLLGKRNLRELYRKIFDGETISTKEWKELQEVTESGWDSFQSNPNATEKYIEWVTKGSF